MNKFIAKHRRVAVAIATVSTAVALSGVLTVIPQVASALTSADVEQLISLGVISADKAAEITPKTGKIVACLGVNEDIGQVILTSKNAQIIKLPLKNIPRLGRATQGVILMRTGKGGSIAAVTCLEKDLDSPPPPGDVKKSKS